MQGMNLVMATCLRELQDEETTLHFFGFIFRQADPNLFHRDAEMLFAATQTLSVTLRGMVAKCSPSLAEKFANSDIDNMPILVQNWLIDSFVHVLPIAAAAARMGPHCGRARNHDQVCFPASPLRKASNPFL